MGGNWDGKGIQAFITANQRSASECSQEERGRESNTNRIKGFAEGYRRYSAIYAWPKWWWLSALVLALAIFSILPGRAYAVSEQVIINDGIVTKPNSDQVTRGFMVLAYNRLNAGALICGYDPSTFTAEQKAKLSQKISGNNFYGLCSYLSTTDDSGVPYWASSNYQLFSTIWDLNSDVAGMDLWIGDFSEHELELAKRDIQKVLDGEELVPPSGGGDEPVSSYTTIEFTPFDATLYSFQSLDAPSYYRNANYYVYKLGDVPYYGRDMANVYGNLASSYNVGILSTWYTDLMNQVDGLGWSDPVVIATLDGLYAGGFTIKFSVYHKSQLSLYEDVNGNVVGFRYPVGEKYVSVTSVPTKVYANGSWPNSLNDLPNYLKYEGRSISLSSPMTFAGYEGTPGIIWSTYDIAYAYITKGGDWPDDPPVVAPSPPELPTPTDPVIPNPPTDPTPPEPPTYITQPYYVTNIFTADLQGILDALDEHCQHLQNALYSDLKSLNDNLISQISSEGNSLRSTIGSNIRWLGDIIQRTIDTLDFNIHSYFHWLADQFDFQNSGGYNDSTVVAWLKKIYAKLGGGSPVNPKPVDPVSDPFDFGEWLYQLWQNFVLDLLALGANGVAEIAHDLGELIHKFPFSVPWDIAAMLALLAAEPQTPVITWPMFYLDAGGVHTVQTTIDLHPYDNYVEPVRVMIKIAFAAVLAWRTKDMMDLLTAARGGNSA